MNIRHNINKIYYKTNCTIYLVANLYDKLLFLYIKKNIFMALEAIINSCIKPHIYSMNRIFPCLETVTYYNVFQIIIKPSRIFIETIA